MSSVTRAAAVVGLMVVGALGGCAGSGGVSSVSVSNLSDATLSVHAALDAPGDSTSESEDAPVTSAQTTLEPGTQAGFALEHPAGGSPSVRFVVRVEGDASIQPYTFTMGPPAPFLLKITGPASDLRLEREHVRPATDRDGLVPADPNERRWRGGYPG